MELLVFDLPPISTNAYLGLDPERKEAVLFDAPLSAWGRVEKFLQERESRLTTLLLTHGHWDHILGASEFTRQSIPVFGHRGDDALFSAPSEMASYLISGVNLESIELDRELEAGETIQLLGRDVEIRHIPGHSEGSILYYFRNEQLAITGDAIFAGSIGRTDLPGADAGVLLRSIRQEIYTLPDETTLYPGHGPPTSVAQEKRTNPFVRG